MSGSVDTSSKNHKDDRCNDESGPGGDPGLVLQRCCDSHPLREGGWPPQHEADILIVVWEGVINVLKTVIGDPKTSPANVSLDIATFSLAIANIKIGKIGPNCINLSISSA